MDAFLLVDLHAVALHVDRLGWANPVAAITQLATSINLVRFHTQPLISLLHALAAPLPTKKV
jgi:hypothetical protein